MANKTVQKKGKKSKFKGKSLLHFTNARAYLFIHHFKPSNCIAEFSELARTPLRKIYLFMLLALYLKLKGVHSQG